MGKHQTIGFLLCFLILVSLRAREVSPSFADPKARPLPSVFVSIPSPPRRRSRKHWLSKKGHKRPKKKVHKKTQTKLPAEKRLLLPSDFLGLQAAVKEYQERWRAARFSKERKNLKKKSEDFLQRRWPRRKYLFAKNCTLFFDPARQKKHRPFWIFLAGKKGACSQKEIRIKKQRKGILRLLKTAKAPVFLEATLFLEKIRLSPIAQRDPIFWKWKGLQFSFADPYLAALYQKYRPRHLPKMRVRLTKASELPLFFSILEREGKRKSPEELQGLVKRYLPRGQSLLFDRDCPLRFLGGLEEPERGLLRFQIEAGCLSKARRRFVMLLPASDLSANFFRSLPPQSLFRARLRFQEILWEESQFYPLWDTILKAEPFSNKAGLPLRYFAP